MHSRTKLPSNEFTTLTLKGRDPRRWASGPRALFLRHDGSELSQSNPTQCCALTNALTPEDLQRISEANIKHGRQTKDQLAAQRHAAKVGRRVMSELKKLERQLFDAGLMPDD